MKKLFIIALTMFAVYCASAQGGHKIYWNGEEVYSLDEVTIPQLDSVSFVMKVDDVAVEIVKCEVMYARETTLLGTKTVESFPTNLKAYKIAGKQAGETLQEEDTLLVQCYYIGKDENGNDVERKFVYNFVIVNEQ